MARNPHNRQMINSGSAHIRDSRMTEIMKPEPMNVCTPAGGIKGGLNGTD